MYVIFTQQGSSNQQYIQGIYKDLGRILLTESLPVALKFRSLNEIDEFVNGHVLAFYASSAVFYTISINRIFIEDKAISKFLKESCMLLQR